MKPNPSAAHLPALSAAEHGQVLFFHIADTLPCCIQPQQCRCGSGPAAGLAAIVVDNENVLSSLTILSEPLYISS